jgi:hypothetical protein
MALDDHVFEVLVAMEVLEGRVQGATRAEISFLVTLGSRELDEALARAVVEGWATRGIVAAGGERAGVRSGTAIYRLTATGIHRILAA